VRLRFDAEAERAAQEAIPETVETTTLTGLRPWRDVVQPHPDVASGRYLQAEFAADLSDVLAGTAEREYQGPVEFFQRTYLTEGLLAMLVTGLRRPTAQGGDLVVQLQTAFGGGKTHSMLALYHLCGGSIKLGDFPGGERIAAQIGAADHWSTAVIITSVRPVRNSCKSCLLAECRAALVLGVWIDRSSLTPWCWENKKRLHPGRVKPLC
jgi:hypothetical protein